MARRSELLVLIVISAFFQSLQAADQSPWFPFVLSWDDDAPGAANLSAWLPKPAGRLGVVHAAPDGHFYTGSERIRFFGVNMCFGANFPTKGDAPKIAARMAKFGINAVRFHHMDMNAFPGGILARNQAGTRDLDPEALDRLDFFVAELKKRGIYTNLNLLVSRPFKAADGLPQAIEQVDWKDRHVVGFFDKAVLRLQKEYANKLLSHRNPYTQTSYAEEPALAFVEINNENGLIQAWLGNQVDRLPDIFRQELRTQWNAWLVRKYETTARLRLAWNGAETSQGDDFLANRDFANSIEPWRVELHDKAKAQASVSDDAPPALREKSPGVKSLRLEVTESGAMPWYVQLNQSGFPVSADQSYTLSFWAKAEKPERISVNVGQAHEPWQILGFSAPVALTTDWKRFQFVFTPSKDDAKARLSFSDLARQKGTIWLARIALHKGGAIGLGDNESVEQKTIPLFAHKGFEKRTVPAQLDWIRFLWDTENTYWETMRRYVQDELHVRCVVIGTIQGCSTPNLMAPFDAMDTHAYWQHPQFPGRQWDPSNWTVRNISMVNSLGGTLPNLALRRMLNKPHCVTEYNHSAPNTYSSEAFLLLAAYGALQDWDALFAFSYSHRTGNWNQRFFNNFFDIDQHPTKMATVIPAAAMFVRGDVKPARGQVIAALPKDREIDALRTARAWNLVSGATVGVPRTATLVQRVALTTDAGKGTDRASWPKDGDSGRFASDTGELLWDLSDKTRGVVTIDAPLSKAVIGFGGGKQFTLGDVVIEPGATLQNGWSAMTVTQVGNAPKRLLITATGSVDNTDMKWKDATHESVGRDWGKAPSRTEGITARFTFRSKAADTKAWALDEYGRRKSPVAVEAGGEDRVVIDIGAKYQTLWYEVEFAHNNSPSGVTQRQVSLIR